MNVLALEFSSPHRSVAFVAQPFHGPTSAAAQSLQSGPEGMQPFALIQAALQEAQVEREQVEVIAVGIGPGSYTGIRAAIAIAQGWQLARDVHVLGISSAENLAAQALELGLRGQIAVVIDAQRNEFYLGEYQLTDHDYQPVQPLRLSSKTKVLHAQNTGCLLVGPEVTRWFPQGRLLFPLAATLGRLALQRTDFLPGEKLQPIYLRPVQFVKAPPHRSL